MYHLKVGILVHVEDQPFVDTEREPDYAMGLEGAWKRNALSSPSLLRDFVEYEFFTWSRVSSFASFISAAGFWSDTAFKLFVLAVLEKQNVH